MYKNHPPNPAFLATLGGTGAVTGRDESRGLRSGHDAPVSPAGSGAVCQWQTFSTDRSGNGDRCWCPLGTSTARSTRSLQRVDRALARLLLFL